MNHRPASTLMLWCLSLEYSKYSVWFQPLPLANTHSRCNSRIRLKTICRKVTGAQNATLGPSAPTIASSLDFFGPSLSHNWVARKFKEANTVVASLSTASCDAGLHHFCLYTSTEYTVSLRALPSLTSRVTTPRPEEFYRMFGVLK